jgi:Zn-dependent protease
MSTLEALSIWVLPLLFAITLHEVAHGWMARYLGDPTAEQQGRLSLNPIKHIDLVGTILVPLIFISLILYYGSGFVFGWAKPVPVNIARLNSPKRDMAVVAAAGPLANLAMALLWALLAKLGMMLYPNSDWIAIPLILMGQVGILINLILMILNLLPVPPLDGGRVLAGVLPDRLAYGVIRVEPFGLFVVIGLLLSGLLGQILEPPYQALSGMINHVFALSPLGE